MANSLRDADELLLSAPPNGGAENRIRDEANTQASNSAQSSNLRIVRLLAPDLVQNGTQNVTIGKLARTGALGFRPPSNSIKN